MDLLYLILIVYGQLCSHLNYFNEYLLPPTLATKAQADGKKPLITPSIAIYVTHLLFSTFQKE